MELIWIVVENIINHWYISLAVLGLILGIVKTVQTIVCVREARKLVEKLGNNKFNIKVALGKVSVSSVSEDGKKGED